ncbi:MAG: hypothetical protein Q4D76_05395 [Oscillospiraceae bacterium]|nr:hypothetical protein [Oscillospiraceae bacterium]
MNKPISYLPREFNSSDGKIKLVNPPKGKVTAKAAYRLEHGISVKISANESQSLKSLAYVKRNEF